MLVAMGAGAFAFSSSRKALITEGFTDSIMLPRLLREATEKDRLDYQVVPHLAGAYGDQLADLDLVASRVVFLVDGDKGGQDHANRLLKVGHDSEQILYLGGDLQLGHRLKI